METSIPLSRVGTTAFVDSSCAAARDTSSSVANPAFALALVKSRVSCCVLIFLFAISSRRWKPRSCAYTRPTSPNRMISTSRRFSSAAVMSAVAACTLRRIPPKTSNSHERSEERRVGKSVDLGGRRILKKKKKRNIQDANIEISKENQQDTRSSVPHRH